MDHDTDQWTRIKSPETDLQIFHQLISEKVQKRKIVFPTIDVKKRPNGIKISTQTSHIIKKKN